MKSFQQILSEVISPYDDWGVNSTNTNLITEAGLSRVLQQIETRDFAIVTAYRKNYTKDKNISRNRELRSEFNKRKMGVYQLVGHWRECSLTDVPYNECPKDKLVDVIERSYLVVRPENMSQEEFRKLIIEMLKRFEQDGAVLKEDGKYLILEKDGSSFQIGTKLSLGKIAQGYSQHIKKLNVPFVFEGLEVPSTKMDSRIMMNEGIRFPTVNDPSELRTWEQL